MKLVTLSSGEIEAAGPVERLQCITLCMDSSSWLIASGNEREDDLTLSRGYEDLLSALQHCSRSRLSSRVDTHSSYYFLSDTPAVDRVAEVLDEPGKRSVGRANTTTTRLSLCSSQQPPPPAPSAKICQLHSLPPPQVAVAAEVSPGSAAARRAQEEEASSPTRPPTPRPSPPPTSTTTRRTRSRT